MTFVKGQSGNPEGRPVGARSFTTKVKEALEKIADGKDYTYEEAFIKAILKKGIVDQDTGMMRTIWEQLDGKPLQKTDITSGGETLNQMGYDRAKQTIIEGEGSDKSDSPE